MTTELPQFIFRDSEVTTPCMTAKLGVECRAAKMIPSVRYIPYEEILSLVNLFSLEKRRLTGKIIEYFKIINGFTNVDPTNLFEMDDSTQTRHDGVKLKYKQVHADCTKFLFTNAVVRDRNKIPPSIKGKVGGIRWTSAWPRCSSP